MSLSSPETARKFAAHLILAGNACRSGFRIQVVGDCVLLWDEDKIAAKTYCDTDRLSHYHGFQMAEDCLAVRILQIAAEAFSWK
jgi:hypothetical protein